MRSFSYSFCTNNLDALEKFKENYYKWDNKNTAGDESETNFIEILSSEADITGLQTLVDRYLLEDTKMSSEYTITFKNEDGTIIAETIYQYGDKVIVPAVTPKKSSDTSGTYAFMGWDKEVGCCVGDETYTAVFEKQKRFR